MDIKKIINNRESLNDLTRMLSFLPDEQYLKIMYRIRMGKRLNLKNPQTFNEKLQWLKLYDRKPEYTMMVDKYEVKSYVASVIGEKYIIPTLGVWDHFDDIDFDTLPEQFVLKCTHDSGGLIICKDKSKLDLSAAKKKIEKSLKCNFYWIGREWPYKDVKPRIIAEAYMEDTFDQELRDYKFFTFNGDPKLVLVSTGRGKDLRFDFFDKDFNHLDFTRNHPNADITPYKPDKFEEMKILAAQLAKSLVHARIDFYEVNGKVYFGEITFFSGTGMKAFEPESWDLTLGSWICLPYKNGGGIGD